MEVLLEALSFDWAIRALIASSLVGIMCGVLGCFIVLRNMSLIGDALSHAILPGIFVAFIILGYSSIGFFIGSVLAGLVAAVLITWIQHNVQTKNDAAIGIVFTLLFSIGVIGITAVDSAGVHLDMDSYLFGDVLGVTTEDLVLTACITVYTLVSISLFYRYLFISTFQPTIAQTMGINVKYIHYFLMLLLSLAVVASLRTVGVILVVAMLITPASTALLLSDKLKVVLVLSGILGLVTAVVGLISAIITNAPPGPAIVVVGSIIYALVIVFAPQKGLLRRGIRKRNQRIKIEREDILRQAIKYHERESLTKEMIMDRLGYSIRKMSSHLRQLVRDGLLSVGKDITLTIRGVQQANELVRAHRLWESYQVQKMGLKEGQIHDEADRLEHHLTREILDEVDANLGYPETDPHGSPIPKQKALPSNSLLNFKPNSRVRIAKKQLSKDIESELWELGLPPESIIIVGDMGKDYIGIRYGQKSIKIPAELAESINVN